MMSNRRSFIKKIGFGGVAVANLPYLSTAENLMKQADYQAETKERPYNDGYENEYLNKVAFPIGGIGSGMFCLEGTGAISHLSVQNHPDVFNEPYAFAAIHIKEKKVSKVLEGPVPAWKLFGLPGSGLGRGDKSYGLPRFEKAAFLARFPFAYIELTDRDVPLQVKITGWSPFIPTDEDNSSLPVGVLEYSFKNNTNESLNATFSYNARNFIDGGGKITDGVKQGFKLTKAAGEEDGAFGIYVSDGDAVVDYCWFRGGWFDSQTILWENIRSGKVMNNPPVAGVSPGASIFVPLSLAAGEEKTIRVNFCWHFPKSNLAIGQGIISGEAFNGKPSKGTAPNQQKVSGFAGKQLLNSFDPKGDGSVGVLQSPEFTLNRKYLKFLAGGGNKEDKTFVRLMVDGKIAEVATGNQSETLSEKTWDVKKYLGKKAKIQVGDIDTEAWGHILADQFVLTDNPDENLASPSASAILLADFEGEDYSGWENVETEELKRFKSQNSVLLENPYYKPWYAGRFQNLGHFIQYWESNKKQLKADSEIFRDAFYRSSLPLEVMEAIAANLTILKSPTVLRQNDGRFWAWEGCGDNVGSCHGSCTHVWNYAQAVPHLFPKLERSLRETEFKISQNKEGHQNFRSNLPISPPSHNFHSAADGQLGGIMKVYRDWRISGDTEWLKNLYPYVKTSLDYCIRTWDPEKNGYLREPQHNTYDIEFWGANGMCTGFYLGALTAFVEMSKTLKEPYGEYEALLTKGKKYMEDELFDGDYFIQKIQWEGLKAPNPTEALSFGGNYSSEAVALLKKEGPKYQYGSGCLSDGILGMWLASVCGLKEIVDDKKVKSHLVSVHKHNLKRDLTNHYNPQRPTYACGKEGGLLLCTWHKGGALSLPFVYSNEVWTGIEYQVAGHLMFKGEVAKGLDIVRECRKRYDGRTRNPFNEYECGHWYARAMSSYAMLQALTGVRYDAIDKIVYIDSKIGDFTCFISTHSGFGNVSLKNGVPRLKTEYGTIDVKKFIVSGKEIIL
ncbi:MAG: hypothetical protein LBS52_03990 [Dysgonamonadaceae bacterium]|jgi:uncharacterized protein (DUF608 family)|nr:hypothetical protein [Dysgonamonadaceae bacterium]